MESAEKLFHFLVCLVKKRYLNQVNTNYSENVFMKWKHIE